MPLIMEGLEGQTQTESIHTDENVKCPAQQQTKSVYSLVFPPNLTFNNTEHICIFFNSAFSEVADLNDRNYMTIRCLSFHPIGLTECEKNYPI